MSRIYPAGSRVDSSNYDPVPSWNVGSQVSRPERAIRCTTCTVVLNHTGSTTFFTFYFMLVAFSRIVCTFFALLCCCFGSCIAPAALLWYVRCMQYSYICMHIYYIHIFLFRRFFLLLCSCVPPTPVHEKKKKKNVALDYQTSALPMRLNDGKFRDNGECG